jgi:hypothetical protein
MILRLGDACSTTVLALLADAATLLIRRWRVSDQRLGRLSYRAVGSPVMSLK